MTKAMEEARAIALAAARQVHDNADARCVDVLVEQLVADALAARDADNERLREAGIEAYYARQIEWSRETFGPELRTGGVLDHIRKELAEIEAAPHDLSEWVDVIILAMDGFWRHGGGVDDLLPRLRAKQEKNMARTWPDWRTMSEDQAIEHDRSGEAALAAASALTAGEREPVAYAAPDTIALVCDKVAEGSVFLAHEPHDSYTMPLYTDSELETLRKERDEATAYMRNLLSTFVDEHFPDNGGWKPLDDLVGMLMQFDNASTIAREYKARLAEALKALEKHRSDREYIIGWDDGFGHAVEEMKFPTMLRKLWSGGEVQKWLDEQFAARRVRDGGRTND